MRKLDINSQKIKENFMKIKHLNIDQFSLKIMKFPC